MPFPFGIEDGITMGFAEGTEDFFLGQTVKASNRV